jgi:hypothetical protein
VVKAHARLIRHVSSLRPIAAYLRNKEEPTRLDWRVSAGPLTHLTSIPGVPQIPFCLTEC